MLILFIFGLIVGSFLNVVALRYDPEKSVFNLKNLSGRSCCPQCRHTLYWYDTVPLFSFIFLLGKCRYCGARISWRYPLVEIISGFVALFPLYLFNLWHIGGLLALGETITWFYFIATFWTLALWSFLLLALIDLRHFIIPDGTNLFIAAIGISKIFVLYLYEKFDLIHSTFLDGFASIAGLRSNIFINYSAAALFGALFFGIIIYVTRGRGMGIGDLKLAIALGLILGWPDVVLAILLSFIIGSVVGLIFIIKTKKSIKKPLPFGPFMVLGVLVTIFFGFEILRAYFSFFNL